MKRRRTKNEDEEMEEEENDKVEDEETKNEDEEMEEGDKEKAIEHHLRLCEVRHARCLFEKMKCKDFDRRKDRAAGHLKLYGVCVKKEKANSRKAHIGGEESNKSAKKEEKAKWKVCKKTT